MAVKKNYRDGFIQNPLSRVLKLIPFLRFYFYHQNFVSPFFTTDANKIILKENEEERDQSIGYSYTTRERSSKVQPLAQNDYYHFFVPIANGYRQLLLLYFFIFIQNMRLQKERFQRLLFRICLAKICLSFPVYLTRINAYFFKWSAIMNVMTEFNIKFVIII